jgi:hypothetical protein
MRRFFYFAAIALLLLSNAPAQAQNFIVTLGLIQVPYFRMEWLPGGGTHIQAPFVNIYTSPPCDLCHSNTVSVGSENSQTIDLPLAPDAPLAQKLVAAAHELNRALANFDTGNLWQNYLGLAPGGPLVQLPVERRPGRYLYPVSSKLDLGTLLTRFDNVIHDDRFRAVTTLPAFERTHRLLSEYLAERRNTPAPSAEEIPPPVPTPPPADERPQPLDL